MVGFQKYRDRHSRSKNQSASLEPVWIITTGITKPIQFLRRPEKQFLF